ncbi:uncharacterized protein LOC18430213 [Amborella trichopoda]|uniref:Uncharacterized protein n=1 Tax=Amborella trichopoda TaxID=13333 RepID=W1P567_AMBTC|nr:uncharacterized protein LOC18430213 [Amborella trichopoda]XP_020520449.1 uncharacterized protein LOC18430213 [Amborella trichopoda]ERN02110.1 hypothetical protein AMTR_s00045p00164850 [Amborella trichopoda]|eukprot:XP_006840435.1 uncharacterized protein LOC18430213 [Amborella trichopoda]
MGFISRRVFPVCGSICVCCPALRSRSRQPVKRYKKLLSDIFPKSLDGPPNERRITKLCEYAAKNPFRIPKIAKFLEQRSHKELHCDHFKYIEIIMQAFNKLLSMCKEQMPYFAIYLLNVISDHLDQSRPVTIQILGCQTLTNFIYSQADGTYTHNIEGLVRKVCVLARESGEESEKRRLRASSLQCLSAMVWFMAEFSHIFTDFDEIIYVTLDNYAVEAQNEVVDEGEESHHNWVNEVIRCETRSGACVVNDMSPSYDIVRPHPEIKDPSILSREEMESPKVWSQICIQRMVQLAKETTTMRRVLDPMFLYFDTRRQWTPRQGLALFILSDMSYLMASTGNDQLILAAIIRHLDHKNIAHDPLIKSNIIQICTALVRLLKSRVIIAELSVVSDLCRHLRKSLQASTDLVSQQDSNWNISLQHSIEDCLLEITKKIGDARPLFDMMTITLEKLPTAGLAARATIGALLILAHIVSLVCFQSYVQQVFPEALLLQLLNAMIHPDTETRVAAHRVFSVILLPASAYSSSHSDSPFEARRWHSKATSAFASASALLEKLRREKESINFDKRGNDIIEDAKNRESSDEEWKHGYVRKSSPNFYRISRSMIDVTANSGGSVDTESNFVRLSEDQAAQLLCGFWIQANLHDNLPQNYEAIAHSFMLTLLCSRTKSLSHDTILQCFQLALSLRRISLEPDGKLSPSRKRSLYMLAASMFMSAAKIYHIPELNDLLKASLSHCNIDPFVNISDDLQICVASHADLGEYGSASDEHAAYRSLSDLRATLSELEKTLIDIIVRSFSGLIEMDHESIAQELSNVFTPTDSFLFGPGSVFDSSHNDMSKHSKESLSSDEDILVYSQIEDDLISETSAAELPRLIPKVPVIPSIPHIISVGQLLESALEAAGHVASSSVSTSPLPYSAMASQCEALARRKISTWLSPETKTDLFPLMLPTNWPLDNKEVSEAELQKASSGLCSGHCQVEGRLAPEPWQGLRLPPASPFDNFLRAAGC